MQYNPTLFCQYLSCRLLLSCSADLVQRQGEERLVELGRWRLLSQCRVQKRLLCLSKEPEEEENRK